MHNVYPDELFYMTGAINKRQVDEMIAQLRIVSNPHLSPSDASALAEELMGQRRRLHGFTAMHGVLDKEGLMQFKADLAKESLSIRVK